MFVKVPGTVVEFEGQHYVLPPLTIGALEQLGDKFDVLTGGGSVKEMSIIVDMVHGALLRNYPEMTREVVAGFVDMGNVESTIQAMLKRSGLTKNDEPVPVDLPSGETSAIGSNAGST